MGHLPPLRDARTGVATLVDAGSDLRLLQIQMMLMLKRQELRTQNIFGKDVSQ